MKPPRGGALIARLLSSAATVLLLQAAPALGQETRHSLTVIGVKPEAEDRDDARSLDQPATGFGLNTLLAEALYDTGRFRLLEERDAAQREYLDGLVLTYWKGRGDAYAAGDLERAWKALGSDYLAYGSVSYARARRQRLKLGPFSRYKQILKVEAVACLYGGSGRAPVCRSGVGEAEETGTGVVYVYDGDFIDFKKNGAGIATQKALTAAAAAVASVVD